MSKTIEEFESMVYGYGFDIDGFYGWQCWDLFAKYCQYLGYPIVNTTPESKGGSTYAKDLYNFRTTNGILTNFNLVTTPVKGDVVVFKEYEGWTPKSHVGIVISVKNDMILTLGQNQTGELHPKGILFGRKANEIYLPKKAVLGYFRPKCFTKKETNLNVAILNKVPTQAVKYGKKVKVLVKQTIYNAPSNKGTSTNLYYDANSTIICDYKVENDGYIWVSWKSAITGKRRWMKAFKVLNGKITKKYVKEL